MRKVGKNHTVYGSTLNNIAVCLRVMDRQNEAVGYCLESMEVTRAVVGEHHPHFATGLSIYAGCLDSQGKHEEAIERFQQCIEIVSSIYGP